MSDVGEMAKAASTIGQIALHFLNPSVRKLMSDEERIQLSNENQFKINLLENDVANCNRQLDGIVCTNPPELTEDEYQRLRGIGLILDGATALTLYACAREAEALRAEIKILSNAGKMG